MKTPVALLALIGTAGAASRTEPPAGCLVVSKSPATGQYGSVSAAVRALSTASGSDQCIWINQGTYSEQVLVSSRAAKLTIYGYTTDTSDYRQNKVTITASHSQKEGIGNDETGTLRVKAANFKLYNVNVNNGFGKGSQAIALSAYADSGYYGCSFTGFQDTLLANTGTQVYSRCLIQGATDFIFGQHAAAWFEDCDIRVVSASTGYITGMPGAPVRPALADIPTSQRTGLGQRPVVLRLQRLHRRGGQRPERPVGRILPREAVAPVCPRRVPEHGHEFRRQRRRVARVEQRRRAHQQRALWRVRQLGAGVAGQPSGLFQEADFGGVHLNHPRGRLCE